MRKFVLSMAFLAICIFVTAQNFTPMMPKGPSKDNYSKLFADVNYVGDNIESHNMDIYLPKSANGKSKVIILIYGSAWFANNAKMAPVTTIGIPLLDAGFAVATINHRSSPEAPWPAQIQDVKAAIRFIRAEADKYGLDNSFIGITGFSSGGHLSTFAGTTNGVKTLTSGNVTVDIEGNLGKYTSTSSNVDAVVDWFGPVDMLRFANGCTTPNDDKSPEAMLIGKKDPRAELDWDRVVSPLYYVDKADPEILILHGDKDNVVPCCQSINLKEAYDKAGVKAELVLVEGGGHGPVCFSEPYYKKMVEYFKKMSEGVKEPSYTLKSGDVVMTIDQSNGAKVTSLKLGDKELLAQHVPAKGWQNNVNDYGSTFWPSPQTDWNWPPIKTYDNAPYSVKAGENCVTMTSGKDNKYPYIFIKEFKSEGNGAFAIKYTIKNASDKAVSVAPWEITRVPGAGVIFFDAPSIRPENVLPSEKKNGLTWLPFSEDKKENRKIFADAEGWLAFANDGMLFVKQFDNITTEKAAPKEDEVEIYVNRGTTYIEIENQGAYEKIEPGKEISWTVRWILKPIDKSANQSLLKSTVKKYLK